MFKYLASLAVLSVFFLVSCGDQKEEPIVQKNSHTVLVKSTLEASNYSYLLVEEDGEEYWIAVPQMDIKEGETLIYSKSLEMLNFQSPSLNRTFERILFVEDAVRPSQVNEIPEPHSQVKAAGKQNISVTPIAGSTKIEQLYSEKNTLKGKSIIVKGVVTRFNEDIMDRNWIHLQDGSGSNDDFDLVITTDDLTEVGKEIIVEGTVAVDKDFGYGYSYSVMLENAKIKSE